MSTYPFWATHKSVIICKNFPNEQKKETDMFGFCERKTSTFQFVASYNSVDVTKVLN